MAKERVVRIKKKSGSTEKASPRATKGIGVNGKVKVFRSYAGQEIDRDEVIEIRPFVSEPAYVRVARGLTINLGNYESARIDVSVTLPCYPEELRDAYKDVTSLVETLIEQEREAFGE